ncbi:MAG: acetyl-CoA carboxylase biotin carboxyl carrier protein subunit [Candidatus Kapaibacteriales bacterium]
MSERSIILNDKEFNTEIKSDSIYTINGEEKEIKILDRPEENVYKLTVNGRVYVISVHKGENGEIKIYRDGNLFEAKESRALERMLEKYMLSTGGGANSELLIKSPMPGLVVKLNVEVGDQVKKGDKPIVIEAMKMENALSASSDGTVKKINVTEGQAVEKNTVLIELE